MDFHDTAEDADFRARARSWLAENCRPKDAEDAVFLDREDEPLYVERAKEFQAKRADAGLGAIHWPREYGGSGGTPIQTIIWSQEELAFDVPRWVFEIGLGMCGPTLMAYADQETKNRLLSRMVRGDDIWCQMFSEPAAGSDVAAIRTRAERDGDDWLINGQKVWTSGAHYSEYGILLARHDPTLPKHKGLTFFWVDMATPGIEVKPIRQISGRSHFNEVFFTDVRIPDSQRLGEIGEGWQVAITTLMNERLAVGAGGGLDFPDIFALARKMEVDGVPVLSNTATRDRLADWYVQSEGLRLNQARTLTRLSRGETPGPESSIEKVVGAPKIQDIASFGVDLLEQAGVLLDSDTTPGGSLFQENFLASPSLRIGGGTDEVLRNVIAERVLQLPGDIRVDRDVPFKEIPRGRA